MQLNSSLDSNDSPLDKRVGEIVFTNIYSRLINGEKESWDDLIQRMDRYLSDNGGFSPEVKAKIVNRLQSLKINCSGRAMWVGGTEWSREEDGILGLNNCYAGAMDDLSWFPRAMNLLMCGGGVGMNVEQQYIDKLPPIKSIDSIVSVESIPGQLYDPASKVIDTVTTCTEERDPNKPGATITHHTITIGDSRKGWCDGLAAIIDIHINYTRPHIYLEFGNIRPNGSVIKGFGGTSNAAKMPGNFFAISALLAKADKFTDILCEKILGLISEIVVAGNVRRSSRLTLYSAGSKFADLKKNLYVQRGGKWVVDSDRSMCTNANHTAVYKSTPTLATIIESVTNQFRTGEGAILNEKEALNRINKDRSSDNYNTRLTANPCLEIIGIDGLACNLAQVQLKQHVNSRADDIDESFYCAGQVAASLLMRDFPDPLLQSSREDDPIVGVSFTGVIDFFIQKLGREYIEWWLGGRSTSSYYPIIEAGYFERWRSAARKGVFDFCKKNNLKMPTRVTTVQPGGTASLLTNCSAGIHWPKATRYIRRLTMPAGSPIALAAKEHGFLVIPSAKDKDSNGGLLEDIYDPLCTEWMVEVPIRIDWADLAEGLDINRIPATAQLDFSLLAMRHYADHTVSQTLELREDEILPLSVAIHKAIENDEGYVSTAILPRFDASSSPFPRLPYEPCSSEEYRRRVSLLKDGSIDFSTIGAIDGAGSGCDSEKCEIRK